MQNDPLHDLLREARQQEQAKQVAEPSLKKTSNKTPDAVVFVKQTLLCHCGREYHSPNPLLLFRYGKSRNQIDHWPSTYNTLPREWEEVVKNIPACQECFSERLFEAKEVISRTRK